MSFEGTESVSQLKRIVSFLNLPYALEDASEANGNKRLMKTNFEHFST